MHKIFNDKFLDLCSQRNTTELFSNLIAKTFTKFENNDWYFLLENSINYLKTDFVDILVRYDIFNKLNDENKNKLILNYISRIDQGVLLYLAEKGLSFDLKVKNGSILMAAYQNILVDEDFMQVLLSNMGFENKCNFMKDLLRKENNVYVKNNTSLNLTIIEDIKKMPSNEIEIMKNLIMNVDKNYFSEKMEMFFLSKELNEAIPLSTIENKKIKI